jgi:hypothetical protein
MISEQEGKKTKFNKNGIFTDGEKAYLRGISKPVNGIFAFHQIESIKKVFDESLENPASVLNINRDEGGHSVSPFITHIAESLLSRSRAYYQNGMYMLSAIMAKEATEILNGFHLMMMLESIYWHTLAETSLVNNILGIDENMIAKNTAKRLYYVKKQVIRLTQNNKRARSNVLNQIFNDVRQLCHEKELFKAADIAFNELVNIRYGVDLGLKLL